MSLALIKYRFERAALRIGADGDDEDFHLAQGRVPHFVGALRQPERPAKDERERERLAGGRGLAGAPRLRLGELDRQRAVRKKDLEILVQAGGELFAANGGEIEHLGK